MELSKISSKYYRVVINGLFHQDDKICLRTIVKQLNVQVGGEIYESGSFADKLNLILTTLNKGDFNTAPVIFILENMDLLAEHPKQILLYNLFDISQSSKSPILVVGLTSRIDTLLLLEKRVKSRFSHRMIDFYPQFTLQEYMDIIKRLLMLDKSCGMASQYVDEYNSSLIGAFEDLNAQKYLTWMFEIINDFPSIIKICSNLVSQLSDTNPYITDDSIYEYYCSHYGDSKIDVLNR